LIGEDRGLSYYLIDTIGFLIGGLELMINIEAIKKNLDAKLEELI
jgi:hypothetical protein